MPSQRHFTPGLFAFLRDLKAHNDRDWFQEHKERYEVQVREPALDFIRDFEPRLEAISPHFRADDRKVGGSLFRIHRDVRFSKDKSPYKTHTGIQFRHAAGKDAHAPCYYLHLEPRQVFLGCGIWHPDTATANTIRTAIIDDPDGWRHATAKGLGNEWELAGDSLKRPPRGVDGDHPLIDDLKRKDFIAVQQLNQKTVTSAGFLDDFERRCRGANPYMAWLCRAVGVDF